MNFPEYFGTPDTTEPPVENKLNFPEYFKEEKPKDDTPIREWLKAQNRENVEITPQIRKRFEAQKNRPSAEIPESPSVLGVAGQTAEDIMRLPMTSMPRLVKGVAKTVGNVATDVGYGIDKLLSGYGRGVRPEGIPDEISKPLPPRTIGEKISSVSGVTDKVQNVADLLAQKYGIDATRHPEIERLFGGGAEMFGEISPYLPLGPAALPASGVIGGSAEQIREGGQYEKPSRVASAGFKAGAYGTLNDVVFRGTHKLLPKQWDKVASMLGFGATHEMNKALETGKLSLPDIETAISTLTPLVIPGGGIKKRVTEKLKEVPTKSKLEPLAEVAEPKVPEVRAKVAEPNVEITTAGELAKQLPPPRRGTATMTEGIDAASFESGLGGKGVGRNPFIELEKSGEGWKVATHITKEGEQGVGRNIQEGKRQPERITVERNPQTGEVVESISKAPVTDMKILDAVKVAETGGIEKPVSEISTKETGGGEYRTDKFKGRAATVEPRVAEQPSGEPPPSGMIGEPALPTKERYPVPLKESSQFYKDWANDRQDVENLSRFLKDNNVSADKILDPQLNARLKSGSVASANSALLKSTFTFDKNGERVVTGEGYAPIIKDYDAASTIKNIKERTAKFDKFLQDNRTIMDLAETGKATPKQVIEANVRLRSLKASNPKEFEQMGVTAKRLYDFQKRMLHTLVDTGIISEESFGSITAKNKFYVPFERIFLDEVSSGVSGKTRPAPKKVLFKMKGSELEVKNTLESIVKKVYEIVDAGQTNLVNRSIAQMAEFLPEHIQRIKTKMIPVKVTAGEIERGMEFGKEKSISEISDTVTDINDVTIFRPRRADLGKNEILVYTDGKPQIYKVSDGIYQGVQKTTHQTVGFFRKVLMSGKRLLQVGATITPDFAFRNQMRDQTGALINTKIKFKPYVDSVRAIADMIGKRDSYYEWLASGGGMESYADLNRASLTKTLNHLRGNRSVLSKFNIITHLGDFSSMLESGTRLGIFKAAKKRGATSREAAFMSREGTLDFSRKGTKGKSVNEVIAFFNAGIQGVDKMARAAKADPVGFAAKVLAAVTIPEIIFQLINRDDEEFKNSPRWRKDMFWHIPGLNVWIPKPFIVGQAFGSIPGRFMEYQMTKDPHAFDGILNVGLEALSPIGMDAAGSLIPSALKPIIETMFNYNFFTQTNLYPEYKAKLLPGDRSSKYTSDTFKLIGKMVGMSPAKLENIYQGLTAGAGKYAVQGTDALINSIRGTSSGKRPTELSDIPVVRGFVGRRSKSIPEGLNRFYRTFEEIDGANTQYKNYIKERDRTGAIAFREKHPEIKYKPVFDSFRKRFSDIGHRIDNIVKLNVSDDKKKELIGKQEDLRLKLLERILKIYSGKTKLLAVPPTIKRIFQ